MQYKEAKPGRIFIARIEDNEDLLVELKNIVKKENIRNGVVHMLGAITNTQAVLGPKEKTYPPDPYYTHFEDAKEIIGLGMIAWKDDEPFIHIHGGIGNHTENFIGCVRKESKVYITIEAVIQEFSSVNIPREYVEKFDANLLKID